MNRKSRFFFQVRGYSALLVTHLDRDLTAVSFVWCILLTDPHYILNFCLISCCFLKFFSGSDSFEHDLVTFSQSFFICIALTNAAEHVRNVSLL